MGFGYRVYVMSLRRERTRENIDLVGPEGKAYFQRLDELLGMLMAMKVVAGAPSRMKPTEDLPSPMHGTPKRCVLRHERCGGRVSCELSAGTVGDRDDLLEAAGPRSINDEAAGRRIRVDFYAPVEGDVGMIVAETSGRSTFIDTLLRWLTRLDALDVDSAAGQQHWYTISVA